MSAGVFIALLILVLNFMRPLHRVGALGEALPALKSNLAHISSWLKPGSQGERTTSSRLFSPQPVECHEQHHKLIGEIAIDSLCFSYHPSVDLIKNISFKVPVGRAVAIVGPSRSGKSTLLLLLAGLLSPTSGRILYDHTAIEQLPANQLAKSVAIVGQLPYLFEGTIEENLTLFNPLLPKAEIIRAAKDAGLHERIMAKKQGYHFVVENGGANLSQGERQCLEIARALAKNPTIFLLDACGLTLGVALTRQIVSNILRRGCTLLLVPSSSWQVSYCDHVFLMDKGRFIDSVSYRS
jgi:ABC-type multidrug transport system fused ATPase/permease subunit